MLDRQEARAAARSQGIAWYTACVVMFAALPAGIVLLQLHYWTTGYLAVAVTGALECFFVGWFVGRSS